MEHVLGTEIAQALKLSAKLAPLATLCYALAALVLT